MAKPAGNVAVQQALASAYYEQPINERMRTFMRLEFLYQQILYNCEQDSDWATRATITTLLEVLAILARGDVRSEAHKELDYQLELLERFQSQPGVDSRRLDTPGAQSGRKPRTGIADRHWLSAAAERL